MHVDVQTSAAGWRRVAAVAAKARKAARAAVAMGGVAVRDGAEIAVALSDDATVRAANGRWRNKDQPTNVLSFPGAPPHRIAQAPFLGDVILAYETVHAEAAAGLKPIDHHLMHLVAHGVLHLIGYDHATNDEAKRMEALETAILASLGIPDPYAGSDAQETGS